MKLKRNVENSVRKRLNLRYSKKFFCFCISQNQVLFYYSQSRSLKLPIIIFKSLGLQQLRIVEPLNASYVYANAPEIEIKSSSNVCFFCELKFDMER